MINVVDIKRAAAGRWPEILTALAGIPSDLLDGKAHPCPWCRAGMDRFSLVDATDGAVLCRKCFPEKNGDGIAALMKGAGCDFPSAIQKLAAYLGLEGRSNGAPKLDPIARMASVKGCTVESLREYGASVDGDAVAFPAYGPERQQCTTFRVWPDADDKRKKGLFAKDKPAGLFFPLGDQGPHFPQADEQWILCEGVKDAAAYQSLGYLACGLNTDHLAAKFATLFRGASVVVMPDRTTDAESKAKTTAALLAGVAAMVKVGTLPLPIDGSRGDDARDVLKLRDGEQLLRQVVEQAVMWQSTSEAASGIRRLTMRQAVEERLAAYRGGPIPRLELGIPKLDQMLGGGVPYGSLTIVGALSSHGKTAFALQAAHWITGRQRIAVTFVSVEMSAGDLAERTISFVSDAPKENWHQLLERLEHDTKIHFTNAAPCNLIEGVSSLADIEREIVSAFKGGIRVAIVDYAQMIDADSRDDTNAIMRRVSATLKRLAKEHGAIVLCLAQLNKRVEGRTPLVPRLTDIEYGSKLGHDADLVLLLMWPHKVDSSKPANDYQIFVEKNRNGRSRFVVNCRFNPPRQRIIEAPEPARERQERQIW